MSNITLFSSGNVPAFARNNELSETAKALTGGSTSNIKRISIKGGVFRLLTGGKEVAAIDERYLDVIIVKAAPKISRVLYLGKWDPENPAPPDCWSTDGEKPDASVKEPQFHNCAKCPQNQAGSGNGDSRACRFQQRLAVVLENDPGGDVLQITLPATSIFGKEVGDKRPLQAYARYLAAQNPPVNPEQLVTRMRFDTSVESPKLVFQPVRWVTDDEYATVLEQGQSVEAEEAIGATTAQADKVAAPALELPGKNPAAVVEDDEDDEDEAPVQRAPKKTAKKRKPVVEEVADDDDEDEPEVRKPAKEASAVPEKKSKLAAIVDDWDDE